MENMSNIGAIESLDEMTTIIKALLNDIAESFVSVGYYLKKTEQDELYKQAGYRNIWEYAKDTFGIGRSTASRFMDINTKYSIGGFSPQIDDKWRGYGSSKLTEMLGLPEEIQEAIPTEATVKDIREAKGIIRETEAHYDDQMESVSYTGRLLPSSGLPDRTEGTIFQILPRNLCKYVPDFLHDSDTA